jgi:DnaK suppressor protein
MELTQIKDQLKTDLQQAEEDLVQLETVLEERPDFGPGRGDAGTQTWEMNLTRKDQILSHISRLQHALERANKGVYGICENCGRPIDPERLEILPTATLCADCAQQHQQTLF